MKKAILLFLTFISINAFSQKIDTSYFPDKKAEITSKEYLRGVQDLAYAYKDIERNSDGKLNYIDYWRLASAYAILGEDKESVYRLLVSSKKKNKKGFCIILNYMHDLSKENPEKIKLYQLLGEKYTELLKDCAGIKLEPTDKKAFPRNKSAFELVTRKGKLPFWKKKSK